MDIGTSFRYIRDMKKKVKLSLDNMIAREELQDDILQINVPETEVVEVKRQSTQGLASAPLILGMSLSIPPMNWVRMLIVRLDREVGHLYKKPRAL